MPLSVELPGRTAPFLIAEVRARVDGVVLQRSYTEGADVRAGQALYQIDPAPYRATLASAEAALQKAEANLATNDAQLTRYKVLIKGNAISQQAYDNALAAQLQSAADVAAAKAATTTARINLGYTSVVSPIAGRSSVSQVTQGGYVQGGPATLLTTVQQIDPMYVDVQQSSAEGLALRDALASGRLKANGAEQAEVNLTLENGSTYAHKGTLEFSGVTVNPATGSVTLRARFPNPEHLLLPGMFVRAEVGQGLQQNVMQIPSSSVTRDPQGQATVMLANAEGKAEVRTVVANTLLHGQWLVESGLKDGERVIIGGTQKLVPGAAVKVLPEAATTAPAAALAQK
nr:efflux RND transporter periplasmic adaptor subunit [Janthinobacterium sp.]